MLGNVKIPKKFNAINKFPNNKLDELFKSFDNTPVYPNNNHNKWINYLAKKKYLSFLIDEKYDEVKLSTHAPSNILDDLLKANNLPKTSNEFQILKDIIVNVGEFANVTNQSS